MRFLHTSDWHLGRSLYGRKRYDEFTAFLNWLADIIQEEKIDALLVAGDIFDTGTPSNRAQELYYRFLCRVSTSSCRYIVIIAGNHDSPSFLNAPKELLLALNVYVVGAMTDDPEDEVIVLNHGKQPEAVVCAIPYLRDRDIRIVEPGETIDEKNAKLVEGLKLHYTTVCRIAERKQAELEKTSGAKIPIVAMGHLFTAGGQTTDGDGVRELYVGFLAHVGKDAFPSSIDYLALGHLHVPQKVGGVDSIRYSGSPIPMGYGEAGQDKKVILIEFNNSHTPIITERTIPCFQELAHLEGTLDDIQTKIQQFKQENRNTWLEIEYTGDDIVGNLREMLDEMLTGSKMEILRIKNKRVMDRIINAAHENETLDDLDAEDVFNRCLETYDVPDEERPELIVSYHEIVQSIQEDDVNAE